jgi:hypothetical protein
MISNESIVTVSNRNYEYEDLTIQEVAENIGKYFTISLNARSNVYSCVPIEKSEIYATYTGQMLNLIFENNQGRQYKLSVKPNCEFITKRGIIKASKLNELDVLIDESDYLCKVIGKDTINVEDIILCELSILYTYNYFCNGILIKGKI